MKRMYILYDSRAHDNTDEACILECAGEYSKPPWKQCRKHWPKQSACLWSYVVPLKKGEPLIDERFEGIV